MTVTINGTTGITNDGGYTGDGVVFADTTPANTLVTTIGGNVGIGTSSPQAKLDIQGGNIVVGTTTAGNSTASMTFGKVAAGGGTISNRISLATYGGAYGAYMEAYADLSASTATYLAFGTQAGGGGTPTERARIDSSGNLLVGTTTALSKLTVYANDGSSADASFVTLKGGAENIGWINYDNAFGTMVRLTGTKQGSGGASDEGYFSVRTAVNATLTGGVYIQGGGTSWTAVSDERQKTDLKPIEDAANKVMTLRAVTGRYLTDAADVSRSFLIAQDVQAVLPEAVVETTQDGESFLGLSYTETIPLLVAAIKEQQAIITALTARVEALEGTQP